MDTKTKPSPKYKGFFECKNHDRLKIFFENKVPTICRQCHTKLKNNLTLFLAQNMADCFVLENQTIQNTDMISEILQRLDDVDEKLEKLK